MWVYLCVVFQGQQLAARIYLHPTTVSTEDGGVRCPGLIVLWCSSSRSVSAHQFGSRVQVWRISPACPSKPGSALHHRVFSACKAMESAPSALQLLQATWSWSAGKSMKYIQHRCPQFQPLVISRNTICPFQNDLLTKKMLPPAWNCRLFLNKKGQTLLQSFERQEKEYGKAFIFHACGVII